MVSTILCKSFIRCFLLIMQYFLCAGLLSGCIVHEFPTPPDTVKVCLRLNFQTALPIREQNLSQKATDDTGLNKLQEGTIRYIIRAFPQSGYGRALQDYTQEFVFSRPVTDGYNSTFTLSLSPGEYDLMIWSDLMESGTEVPHYATDDFTSICLQEGHSANNDYVDAFRGNAHYAATASIEERLPDTLEVEMTRPLAKYEFVTTDIEQFIDKEFRLTLASSDNLTEGAETWVKLDNYRIVFYYIGFLPTHFNLFADRPVNSIQGKQFSSKFIRISETEASLGFDYILVGSDPSFVTVQIGVYDKAGQQLSLTEPIEVPLWRSQHTLLKGTFLMQETAGGIVLQPDYDGNYNLIIP